MICLVNQPNWWVNQPNGDAEGCRVDAGVPVRWDPGACRPAGVCPYGGCLGVRCAPGWG